MAGTKASPASTLLAHVLLIGGPALSVTAGSEASISVQTRCMARLSNSGALEAPCSEKPWLGYEWRIHTGLPFLPRVLLRIPSVLLGYAPCVETFN